MLDGPCNGKHLNHGRPRQDISFGHMKSIPSGKSSPYAKIKPPIPIPTQRNTNRSACHYPRPQIFRTIHVGYPKLVVRVKILGGNKPNVCFTTADAMVGSNIAEHARNILNHT